MNFFNAANMAAPQAADRRRQPDPPSYGGSTTLNDAAQDDISNHNYQAPGGITQ